MTDNIVYDVWFSLCVGFHAVHASRLIALGLTAYDFYCMNDDEVASLDAELPERIVKKLWDKGLKSANEIVENCKAKDIGILSVFSPDYPNELRTIPKPPTVLYTRGDVTLLKSPLSLAMVGTREMSQNGLLSAYELGYELGALGVTVVSGLAAGIDGVSAVGVLCAEGKTIAVLGCAIDSVYPRHHEPLYDAIAERGLILSEYPPKTQGQSYFFPERNRIISGLCQGTLVIEAGLHSGSLITAKTAILQGRDVFAMPAAVHTGASQGTNGLLRDGARILVSVEDLFERYGYFSPIATDVQKLAEVKTDAKVHMDDLVRYGILETFEEKGQTLYRIPGTRARAKTGVSDRPIAHREKQTKTAPVPTPVPTSSAPKSNPTAKTDGLPLDGVQRAILENTADDEIFSANTLYRLGYTTGDLSGALLGLEIYGLVERLPGNMYRKK